MMAQEQTQQRELALVEGRDYKLLSQENIFRYIGRKGLIEDNHTFIREITESDVRRIEIYNFLASDLRQSNDELETRSGSTTYAYKDGRYFGEREKLKFAELIAILSKPNQEAQTQ